MGKGTQVLNTNGGKTPLENRLSGAFKPISPRQEFVHGLGHRIQNGSRATLVNHVANWHLLAVFVAGLLSLAVFIAMLVRALLNVAEKKRPTAG